MRRLVLVGIFTLGIAFILSAQYQDRFKITWIEPGSGATLPEFDAFDSNEGTLGVLNASGPVNTEGHPFFTALGTNGRACVNCHQPTYGMSVSTTGLVERWRDTDGKDPVFAAFDGSNCPSLPQDQEKSHSLLLKRGLFRIPLPWPPKNADGSPKPVEFTIEVVRDPTGCNTSAQYGLKSADPTISVYRRPRPAANLKYVISGGQPIVLKTGMLADVDPETGKPVSMNLMTDAREPSLKTQATQRHHGSRSRRTCRPLAASRSRRSWNTNRKSTWRSRRTSSADLWRKRADLRGWEWPHCAIIAPAFSAITTTIPYSGSSPTWKGNDYYRSSVARGADIFMFRQFWLRDAAHINSIGLGNPLKRTCATCHNAQMTGQDLSAGWVDVGTTNYPTWTEPSTWAESSELPVFKITCARDADPHPYLGRVIYTTDPGRALISGRCVDVGSIVMQQLRGLAARAPYFANGSAKTLREVVDFYDRRFDMKLTRPGEGRPHQLPGSSVVRRFGLLLRFGGNRRARPAAKFRFLPDRA